MKKKLLFFILPLLCIALVLPAFAVVEASYVDIDPITGNPVTDTAAEDTISEDTRESYLIEQLLGRYEQFPGSGVASINFPWIATALLFILFFYCVFRLIGGLAK